MTDRLMSQGMKRLVWDLDEAAREYGQWGGERAAAYMENARISLHMAIAYLEARNTTLESENRRLTQLIEDMRLDSIASDTASSFSEIPSHISESGK